MTFQPAHSKRVFMKIEVKVPSVGESVSTADIESWEKQPGDFVKKGEVLVILETDKASMEIPAEQPGRLEILKPKGEQVFVDEVIALIETSATKGDGADFSKLGSSKETPLASQDDIKSPKQDPVPFKIENQSLEDFSPAVRHLLATSNLNPSQIKGTGRGGRLTKKDILNELDKANSIKEGQHLGIYRSNSQTDSSSSDRSVSSSHPITSLSQASFRSFPDQKKLKPDQRREPMTRLRRVTAERLVQSQRDQATLSTFNEVDLSRIIEIRKNHQEDFIKKYGFKLGFMSFFVKAVASALKQHPKINAFIDGTDIIYNESQHIGIAVSTEKGLVVPVLFYAESLSLAQIEEKIIEYRDKALNKKLSPDDLLGGTFTLSNGGVFGSLLSTPILNPPQSGILGMHKIEQRPVVRNGKIEIRPMMYLALSYDHRIVDGRESVSFLVKVKEGLEEPSRLLIDI